MLGLPNTTEFNKRIPKQMFYEKMVMTAALKKIFVEQIKTIYWRNKLSVDTVNLAEGKNVKEIQVFEVKLNTPGLDEVALRQIDKVIPYHLLYLLEYQGKYQAWICYKENMGSKDSYKVGGYYHTEWMEASTLPVKLEGLDLDAAYENFVRQVAGAVLTEGTEKNVDLKDAVERAALREKLQKKITTLENKIRKEKQFNRVVKMRDELRALKKELMRL
ncbi:DUF4391 domain-containing protein [Phascolarctobacterium sp.]|uniref:DUF4391 domain-containing protein n=1 Tax=Phascolarctobacterium sp. TaxID=2049039 RepID=UPI00386AA322